MCSKEINTYPLNAKSKEELINGCTMFSFDYKVGSDAHFYLKENKVRLSFLLDTLNERYLGNPSKNMS